MTSVMDDNIEMHDFPTATSVSPLQAMDNLIPKETAVQVYCAKQ